MPAKNTLKPYIENSYYHVYNRGVNKTDIFHDDQDYQTFLRYLKEYLSPPPPRSTLTQSFTLKGQSFQGIPHLRKNYSSQIQLAAFVLMPNHFHFLLKQIPHDALPTFVKSLFTRYVKYFNKTYKRVGSLFESRYKAILVTSDNYLLHLSRYIHLNHLSINNNLQVLYSSYPEYLGLRHTPWVHHQPVLDMITSAQKFKHDKYRQFVEDSKIVSADILQRLTLDDDTL